MSHWNNNKVITEDEKYIKIDKEEFIKNCLTAEVCRGDKNYHYYHKQTMHDVIIVYSNDLSKEITSKLHQLEDNIFKEINNNQNAKWR